MKLWFNQPYWLVKDGLISAYPSLEENISCEILVVGSGITGSLLAYKFSKEGFNTVLIDKRDVATGSTAASTAMLQYEIDTPLYKLIEKVGEEIAVDSYHVGVAAIKELERIVKKIGARCGFKRRKSLYLANSEADCDWLRKEFQCRRKFNLDVHWITQLNLKKRYGLTAPGGILSNMGAIVDVYRLAHDLISYSVEHHALRVFDHSSLESVVYNGNENTVLTQTEKRITCKYILYASGYEAAKLIRNKIVELRSTFALVSEPLQQLSRSLRNIILWSTDTPYLYMRTTEDNRILVGGGDENIQDPIITDNLITKKRDYLLDKFYSILPNVKVIPDLTWAGTFGVTKDALPYIGAHPDYPNSFFVLGFGGNGITFSVASMEIIADALAGRPNKFLQYYRFDR